VYVCICLRVYVRVYMRVRIPSKYAVQRCIHVLIYTHVHVHIYTYTRTENAALGRSPLVPVIAS